MNHGFLCCCTAGACAPSHWICSLLGAFGDYSHHRNWYQPSSQLGCCRHLQQTPQRLEWPCKLKQQQHLVYTPISSSCSRCCSSFSHWWRRIFSFFLFFRLVFARNVHKELCSKPIAAEFHINSLQVSEKLPEIIRRGVHLLPQWIFWVGPLLGATLAAIYHMLVIRAMPFSKTRI
jgi:hypothetical protein